MEDSSWRLVSSVICLLPVYCQVLGLIFLVVSLYTYGQSFQNYRYTSFISISKIVAWDICANCRKNSIQLIRPFPSAICDFLFFIFFLNCRHYCVFLFASKLLFFLYTPILTSQTSGLFTMFMHISKNVPFIILRIKFSCFFFVLVLLL